MSLFPPVNGIREKKRSAEYEYVRSWLSRYGQRPLWFKFTTILVVLFVFQTLRIVLQSLDVYVLEETIHAYKSMWAETEEDYDPPFGPESPLER